MQLNPTLADDLNQRQEQMDAPDEQIDDQANQLANLIQNSTLLKSYEQLMAQYESDNDRKARQLAQMERDQQQLLNENNVMSEQLYQLKSKAITGEKTLGMDLARDDSDDFLGVAGTKKVGDLQKIAMEKAEKDKMVELLKRNHDVMLEKYEVFRERNENLEKQATQKEKLYVEIKAENDKIANELYSIRRQAEDYRQENQVLTTKLTSCETQLK